MMVHWWLLPLHVLLLLVVLPTPGDCTLDDANKASSFCASPSFISKNVALVFVKPHANTAAVRELVAQTLTQSFGMVIQSEHDLDPTMVEEKLDRHYFAISSRAMSNTKTPTALRNDNDIPTNRFQEAFGESWDQVVQEQRIISAQDACERFKCTPDQLLNWWSQSKTIVKLGGGKYCGQLPSNFLAEEEENKRSTPLYVWNGFYPSMRSTFMAGPGIHCYVVEWNPKNKKDIHWKDFRHQVLGTTDPAKAVHGSLRQIILERYAELGLTSEPTPGNNGVHGSASPLESLAERNNWLDLDIASDPFGAALLQANIPQETILSWFLDPQVVLPDGTRGSIFDHLEDMDTADCISELVTIYFQGKK